MCFIFIFTMLTGVAARYLSYTPHSGFGNQMDELSQGLALARYLNRTLLVPGILNHFDLALG